MANTFNMLRANDLIWSFVINNYLLGRDPFPFDLLHWNCDSTRMPATMHSFYLRNMYMKNLLREPGGITLAGVPIDLSKVNVPTYFVSAIEDHIAPWKTTYTGTGVPRSGDTRFVLSGSGAHRGHDQSAGRGTSTSTGPTRSWVPTIRRVARRCQAASTGRGGRIGAKWVGAYVEREVPARVPGKGKLPGDWKRRRASLRAAARGRQRRLTPLHSIAKLEEAMNMTVNRVVAAATFVPR